MPRGHPAVRVDLASTVTASLSVANLRFSLPRVRVTAEAGVCGREPTGIDRTSALWEQISLALRATIVTRRDSAQAPPLRAELYERTLDRSLSTVASRVVMAGEAARRPFFAANPDSLAQFGYVRRERDGSVAYFAPDEVVMLSDAFVRTHCFNTPRADADPALAELEFRPAPRRRVPDVAGVAYVDTVSGELRRIVFRYVNADAFVPRGATVAGGEVALRRLANGQWIVSEWAIRMPTLVRRSWGRAARLTGYRETGGSTKSAQQAIADSLAVVASRAERDSLALFGRAGDWEWVDTRIDPSIRKIIRPAALEGRPLFFVGARAVEARTGFARRRAQGDGIFLDSAAIAIRGAKTALDLVLSAPGVEVFRVPDSLSGPTSSDDMYLAPEWRAGVAVPMMVLPESAPSEMKGARCYPKIFLDGRLTPLAISELRQLRSIQVATMEVYAPYSRRALSARSAGMSTAQGNVCGLIQLQSYIDYRL